MAGEPAWHLPCSLHPRDMTRTPHGVEMAGVPPRVESVDSQFGHANRRLARLGGGANRHRVRPWSSLRG